MQSVELLLDEVTSAAVVRQWRLLADAGLPSQARHRGETNAPHVTIGLATSIDAAAEASLVSATPALPLRVRLGALVLFGGRRHVVLARMVVVTQELLALHQEVSGALADCPGQVDHLATGRWVPHVTLARRIAPASLEAALSALADERAEPLDGDAVALRRWDSEARRAWTLTP